MSSCIVALGGGGFSMEPENPRLDRFVLSLARRSPPKICFVPTASGDSDNYIVRFFDAFTVDRCLPSHLRLFGRKIQDLREFILQQDIVYVGDGEKDRRPAYQRAVAEGAVPPGIAADDGVALVYRDAALAEIVSSRPAARAWRVERAAEGARETELMPRCLE